MSTLSRIDDWLIEGPYQAVVDLSQRKPVWWARQSTMACLVMTCIQGAINPGDQPWRNYVLVGTCAVASALQWLVTLTPAWFACMGESRALRLLLIVLALPHLLGLFAPNPASCLAALLGDVTRMSFCYFAACKPPRPRAPRFKLAPGGAA